MIPEIEKIVKTYGGDLSGIGKELRFAYFPTREQAMAFNEAYGYEYGRKFFTVGSILSPTHDFKSYKVRVQIANL